MARLTKKVILNYILFNQKGFVIMIVGAAGSEY